MTIRINSRFFFHTIDRATLRSDAFIYFRFSMCGVFSFPGCLHSFCFWHNGHLINQFQIRQLGLLFHRINVVNLLLFAFFSTLLLVYSYLLSVCFFSLASIKSSLMLRRDIFFIVGFGVPQKPAGEIDGLWESNFSSFTTGIRRCVVCVCVCWGVLEVCCVTWIFINAHQNGWINIRLSHPLHSICVLIFMNCHFMVCGLYFARWSTGALYQGEEINCEKEISTSGDDWKFGSDATIWHNRSVHAHQSFGEYKKKCSSCINNGCQSDGSHYALSRWDMTFTSCN